MRLELESDDLLGQIMGRIKGGESLIVEGAPGTGKSSLLRKVLAGVLANQDDGLTWSPVLLLTPDRRRAVETENRVGAMLLGSVSAPGGHRLVRSVSSYAYLVISQWLVERDESLPRPVLVGGAEEDAWLAQWLEANATQWEKYLPEAVVQSQVLRMDLRNLLARTGEAGLTAQELKQVGSLASQPLWELAADAYGSYAGSGHTAFSAMSPHIDSARVQIIAAETLRQWPQKMVEEGVQAPAPVPKLVLVDDLQDCTPATLKMLEALAACGSQVLATNCSATATAGFRGGTPELATWLADSLSIDRVVLGKQHSASNAVSAVFEAVENWVYPQKPVSSPCTGQRDVPKPEVMITNSSSKSGSHIADLLRNYHYLHGVEWAQQAVIVRAAREIEGLRRHLKHKRVPLAPANRALLLSDDPVCSVLLKLLTKGANDSSRPADDNVGVASVNSEFPNAEADEQGGYAELALQLVKSPLVNVDLLDLYRFLRGHPDLLVDGKLDLPFLLENPEGLRVKDPKFSRVREQMVSASTLWNLADSAAQESPQEGLWTLWEAAGRAESWQTEALCGGRQGEIADESLDAVITLFRRADFWEQQLRELDPAAQANAAAFAEELLQETVAADSVADIGLRPSGVEILTVSQAAGRHWDAVCVAGLQDGSWPAIRRPGGILNLPQLTSLTNALLRERWDRERPLADYLTDPGLFVANDHLTGRHEQRKSEARLLAAAVSRARKYLNLVAVENEEETASPFLDYLAKDNVVEGFRDEDGAARMAEDLQGLDLSSFVGLLRYRTIDPDLSQEDRTQAARTLAIMFAAGVASADPELWVGAGGVTSDLPVDEQQNLWLSPSQLEKATECLLRWFFSAMGADNQRGVLEAAPRDALAIGSLIHEIAEENPTASHSQLQEALDHKWRESGWDDGTWWSELTKRRLDKMIENLGKYFASSSRAIEVIETELGFSIQVGEATVGGRIDRLEHLDDGSVHIVDIKTGTTPTSQKSVMQNLQLQAYQLALRDQYAISAASLLPVGTKKFDPKSQPAMTDVEATQLSRDLGTLSQEMVGPEYSATPGNHCRNCVFVNVCPAKKESSRIIQ